jgi:hypothetical protein
MKAYLFSTLLFGISFSATLPQIVQTLKTRMTRDFNLWNLLLNLLTNLLLTAHGLTQGDLGLAATGIWFTLYWGGILGLKLRNQVSGEEL